MKVIKVLAFFDTAQTGVPVAGTKIYDIPLTGNTLKASQPMEVLQILGQREGSKPSFGNLKPSGAIDSPVTGDLAPLVFMAVMGAPVSTADFTSDAWATATLYDVGDVVNHSNGLHSLVCQVAGTSGATEPDLSAYPTAFDGRGLEVTDDTAIWAIAPKKLKYTFKTGSCLPPLTIEIERGDGCAGGAKQYEKYIGLRFGQLPITFAGGDLTMLKTSFPVEGSQVDGTLKNPSYASISTIAGVEIINLLSNTYSKDQSVATIDGVTTTDLKLTDFGVTVNNNLSSADLIGGNAAYVSIGALDVKGNMSGFLANGDVLALEQQLANHSSLRCEFTLGNKSSGDSIKIILPETTGSYPTVTDSLTEDSKFSAEISSSKGGTENTTVYAEVVSSIPYSL